MRTAIANMKGGVSKTTTAVEVGALLSRDKEVVIVALDSNRSLHDRFVQHHHRQPATDEIGLEGDQWPNDRRLNHLLLAQDASPDIDGHYLYRRDDLPNLGVLFHQAGTLAELANEVSRKASATRRLQKLLAYLHDNYDHVIFDLAADYENPIAVAALMNSDMVLPTTTLSRDGMSSLKETYLTAMDSDIPVHGFVISPYHRHNTSHARLVDSHADVWASGQNLDVLRVPQDATVGKAQDAVCPLMLYRPEELQRKAGHHEFDRNPPKALQGFTDVAQWITKLDQDPDYCARAWEHRKERHAARSQARVTAGRA